MTRRYAGALAIAALQAAFALGITAGPRDQRTPTPAPCASGPVHVLEESIAELQEAMRNRQITARGLVEIYLARIEAYDRRGPRLNAIIALNPRALDEADALDRERAAGQVRGPLHGIPVVVKDNFDVTGLPTTAGTV